MTFYVYTDAAGNWRWRLVAANGRTIADSGEGYFNRPDCERGISLVKAYAPGAAIRRSAAADHVRS